MVELQSIDSDQRGNDDHLKSSVKQDISNNSSQHSSQKSNQQKDINDLDMNDCMVSQGIVQGKNPDSQSNQVKLMTDE